MILSLISIVLLGGMFLYMFNKSQEREVRRLSLLPLLMCVMEILLMGVLEAVRHPLLTAVLILMRATVLTCCALTMRADVSARCRGRSRRRAAARSRSGRGPQCLFLPLRLTRRGWRPSGFCGGRVRPARGNSKGAVFLPCLPIFSFMPACPFGGRRRFL